MPTNRTKENDIVLPAASAAARRKTSTPAPRAKHSLNRSAATPETVAIEQVDEMVAVDPPFAPTESEIAALAYTYWAGRGCQGGSPEEDWLRAENELRAKASA